MKAANLGKFHFLPKIHKSLINVPGKPVISNCGTPAGKVSEYLDFLFKPIMQDGWSYIKDNRDFLKKTKRLGKIPEGAVPVTADNSWGLSQYSSRFGFEGFKEKA